jgi:hypothetical protein
VTHDPWRHGREALAEVAWVVSILFVFLQVCSLMVRFEVPARMLAARNSLSPEHALEAQLLAADPEASTIAILGDPSFVDGVMQRIGRETSLLPLRVQKMDLQVFREASEPLLELPCGRIIVQNSPLFWSDAQFHAPRPDLSFWRGSRRTDFDLFPVEDAGLVFDQLETWAETKGDEWPRDRMRLTSWATLEDRFEEIRSSLVASPVQQKLAPRLVWVADLNGMPADAPSALVERFRTNFPERAFVEGIGYAISLDDLSQLPSRRP